TAKRIVHAACKKRRDLGEVSLKVNGQPMNTREFLTYKSMMLSDVPNLIQLFGYTTASWTLKADLTCNYLARLLRYMDRRGLRVAVARRTPDVQEQPFIDFTSGYVQRAADILPKQGDQPAWRVHQSYLK